MAASLDISALDLKNEGNSHFVKRRFTEALSCYTEGLVICKSSTESPKNVTELDDNSNDELLATLHSNRSGCYYEMGDYDNAAIEARKCCTLLMESMGYKIKAAHDRGESATEFTKIPPMVFKNWWRCARSLHFSNAEDSEVHYVLNLMEKQKENEEYATKATNLREQLNYYQGLPLTTDYEPSLLRASLQDPYVQYYNFGHDISESLLRRNQDSKAQSIILSELEGEELTSLAFLFGGVGDGRHVMATLLDAHHQYRSLSAEKQEQFKLHMTLNDISAQLLAKDALVLVLTYELGQAKDIETALTSSDLSYTLGMVIYYVTLGKVMPPSVHRNLVEYIKRWFTDNTRENFLDQFPWLTISEATWEGILANMHAWVDPEAHYSPPLHTVDGILAVYKPAGGDSRNHVMNELSAMNGGNDMVNGLEAKLKDATEARRAQFAEAFQTIEPWMVEGAQKVLGEDASEEEVREFWMEYVNNIPEDMLGSDSCFFVSNMDRLFLKQTKCLYPSGLEDELTSFTSGLEDEMASFASEATDEEVTAEFIQNYKSRIQNEWFTNPVQIDPWYQTFSRGVKAVDEMDPVKEWPDGFLTEEVCSVLLEPPPQFSSESSDEENEQIMKINTLANNVIRYYWHVGQSLSDLSAKVTLEIDLGSIIALGASSLDRESAGLPTKYHRITLSNIPDYTGMLSVFTTIAPLLGLKSRSITPSLQSNCLFNTGMWKTYDDYTFSTTALNYEDAETVFNLNVTDDEPSVWGPFTVWQQSYSNKSMSHEDLRVWIHRLYLMTMLPPDRDSNSMMREERPGNVSLFLLTLSHCVTDLGIPAHFVASILEDLLKRKQLITKTTLQNESPASSLDYISESKKSYNHSAFQRGLANETAIMLQSNKLGFKLLDTSMLPTEKASLYELKLSGLSSTYSASWDFSVGGTAAAMTLGFILQKSKENEYKISTAASAGGGNPMMMMMAMMNGGGDGMPGGKKSSKLRQALLSSGSKIGHVFSSMKWNLKTQTVSFWMCDDVFEKLKTHYFKLIRTDGWFILPHGDVKLEDAKRIS